MTTQVRLGDPHFENHCSLNILGEVHLHDKEEKTPTPQACIFRLAGYLLTAQIKTSPRKVHLAAQASW